MSWEIFAVKCAAADCMACDVLAFQYIALNVSASTSRREWNSRDRGLDCQSPTPLRLVSKYAAHRYTISRARSEAGRASDAHLTVTYCRWTQK